MSESRVEAWDRMERENAELRRALRPFAALAQPPLSFATVTYGVRGDPERQTFQAAQMQRAFNRASELLRAHFEPADVPVAAERECVAPAECRWPRCSCEIPDTAPRVPAADLRMVADYLGRDGASMPASDARRIASTFRRLAGQSPTPLQGKRA